MSGCLSYPPLPPEFPYTIRRATLRDLDRLLEMRMALQRHLEKANPHVLPIDHGELQQMSLEYYRQRLGNPSQEACCTLVAEADPACCCGMLSGTQQQVGRSLFFGRIDDVWIEPACRRQKVATALFYKILDFFHESGIIHITLDWVDGNEEAQAFWSQFGFRPVLTSANLSLPFFPSERKHALPWRP